MKRLSNSGGFTLIEIMVVVLILGLLATLVAPKIVGQLDKARRTKASADIKGIEEALQLFRMEHGKYPPSNDFGALADGGYLDLKGEDEFAHKCKIDPWGNCYTFGGEGDHAYVTSPGDGKGEVLDSRNF